MSEKLDPLEKELAGLHLPDLTPATRQEIARRLAAKPMIRRMVVGLAAAAVAACLLVSVVLSLSRRPPVDVPGSGPGPVADVAPAPPTLLAYQQALADSEERFNALFMLPTPAASADQPPMPALVSALSDESWTQLLGDR